MNKRLYWKLRKIVLKFVLKIKTVFYKFFVSFYERNEYRDFRVAIVKAIIQGFLKAVSMLFIIFVLDGFLRKTTRDVPFIEGNVFISVLIGGISVAGIILGLYCANISSVFSTRYVNAPKNIASAFQLDKLSRRCISRIVDYIILSFLTILISLAMPKTSLTMIGAYILLSVIVVVSYSISGNRAYQLSNVYEVSADSFRSLYRIVLHQLNNRYFLDDKNFQNHFRRIAEDKIALRNSIQKYCEKVNKSEFTDNSAMVEFMCKNLMLIETYWKNKSYIDKSSLWFQSVPKYSKWHLSNNTESSIALKTGTSLPAKEGHNYWWFEEELVSINKQCLNALFEQYDFSSIIIYLHFFDKLCVTAIEEKETDFYVSHVNWICDYLDKTATFDELDDTKRNSFAGVIESVSILYLNLILKSSKIYQDFDIDSLTLRLIKTIDSGENSKSYESIRNRENTEFYEKIITEVIIEGKRITPAWVIKQQVAKEEYVYLNSLLDVIKEGIDKTFTFGNNLLNKKLYFESCIVFTRFYEYESKLTRFISVVEKCKDTLDACFIDKEINLDEFRLNNLNDTICVWKEAIPSLLSKCSSIFVVNNWEKRGEFPDFLGECYNHICEDAVKAICIGDRKQFEIDFENLSKIMLLYQEYIRSDLADNNLYRHEYAYYIVTSPIVEWAQIGGLAILWGEFNSDNSWKNCVEKSSNIVFKKDNQNNGMAEKLIEYVQNRNRFMLGIGSRDILETGWRQAVSNSIIDSGICEADFDVFGPVLKTESKLLKAFCFDFIEWGFMNDPSEVFWVMCANPIVGEEKKYRTNNSWEDKLNE